MALLSSPLCKFGKKMPEFELTNIDGKLYKSINIKNKDASALCSVRGTRCEVRDLCRTFK